MSDKCTSPEGHKEYGPWRIRYSPYLAQIKIERTNGRLVEEMPKEEAHRILNAHASLTEKVERLENGIAKAKGQLERPEVGSANAAAWATLDALLESE